MKIYTMLFCTALTSVWAMPVSALTFDEKIIVVIDFPTGIQEVRAESLWITDHPSEPLFFDPSLWFKRIELENAFFPYSTGNLVITAYDASGATLTTSSSFSYVLYQPDPNVLEYEVVIASGDQSAVNTFVSGLPSSAKSLGLMPITPVECILDNEDVDIEADFVYDGVIVASDDLNVPGAFACPETKQ